MKMTSISLEYWQKIADHHTESIGLEITTNTVKIRIKLN
jgi:hypothetical protein